MTISVCMATCNGERYIKEQLDSILCQLNEDDEVIISDDSSSDRTVEIIHSYNDKRIKLFENQKFMSPIYNFENALKHSLNEYIFLADQDDIWMNNKVNVCKKYLEEYDLVVSDADIIDCNNNIIHDSFYEVFGSKCGFFKNLIKNSYHGCTIAFNRKVLQRALPFPKDLPMHDWWIGLISEIYGKPYFISENLISYRRHCGNSSPTCDHSRYSYFSRIRFRALIIKSLIARIIGIL